MNFSDGITLSKIRHELMRMEDTIIFCLIERAQFKQNLDIYKAPFKQLNQSYLDFLLSKIEQVHAQVGRYTSPDEHPFTSHLPEPILERIEFPKVLIPNSINYNQKLKDIYNEIITLICCPGDDQNYGSSATKDVELLQALSRRIHFGKFVAEAKFNDPNLNQKYRMLIKQKDRDGIMSLLTNAKVEEKLKLRLRKKVMRYAEEIDDFDQDDYGDYGKDLRKNDTRINGIHLVQIYENIVIPMTKEIEVDYLLQRLDHENFVSVEFYK